MKKLTHFIAIIFCTCILGTGLAQTANWRSMQSTDRHILNLNAGWDYGTSFGIGYGYKLRPEKFPLLIGTELSLPAGEDRVDDVKAKIGAQAEVFRSGNFSATVKAFGIIRRYESPLVRLINFGSEFSAVAGYYRPRWFAAGEFGFDKSIITHMRHSDLAREDYPEIRSGWYIPTGGNFFYGVQLGYSLKAYDVYVKGGKTVTQDFKTTAGIPFYLSLGFNRRF